MTYEVDSDCQFCPALVACRHQVVQGYGHGNDRIMVVGQNPGENEDQQGKPFVGRSGKLLGHLVDTAGIPRGTVYRTNAVRCWSPGNRKPSKEEIDNCRPFLIEEINHVKPKVIIALGEVALTALYNNTVGVYEQALDDWASDCEVVVDLYNDAITDWESAGKPKGQKPKKPKMPAKPKKGAATKIAIRDVGGHMLTQPDTGIPIIPTYHPSYLMRGNWEQVPQVVEHFKTAFRIAEGEMEQGKIGDYYLIDDLNKLRAMKDILLDPSVQTIWYDCETTGTDWKTAELLCISFTDREGVGYVVPILHNPGNGIPELFPTWQPPGQLEEVIKVLGEVFASDKDKGGHNQLFDLRMMERNVHDKWITALTAFGFTVNGHLVDTELTHAAIAEALPHNMTSLLAGWTDMPFYEADIKGKKSQMAKVPNMHLWPYSAGDADGLPRLYGPLRKAAEREGTNWVLDNVTLPLLRMCRHLEDRGFLIDRTMFEKLCDFYDLEIKHAEAELWKAVPHLWPGWKYNHGKTLSKVLFKDLGIPTSGRKTKGAKGCEDCDNGVCFDAGHDQTGKDALHDIIDKAPQWKPLLEIILKLKNLTKRRSTYLDGSDHQSGFIKLIMPDGRIHSAYKISRAETGRLASENPNAQNIPNYVHIHAIGDRCSANANVQPGEPLVCEQFFLETFGLNTENAFHDMVIAPKGKVIVNADWSQLEVWVLAYRLLEDTGDRTLLDVLESGTDIHLWMARKMFDTVDPGLSDKEWKNKHGELRRRAKTLVFGTGYGLTAMGAANRIGCTEEEGQDLIDRYMAVVPGLKMYFKIIRRQLLERGYVENWAGRRRHIEVLPLLKAMGAYGDFEALVREGINFPIQSGGSDLHSIVSVKTDLDAILRQRGCNAIISVHDSLTFEASAPDNQYVIDTAWIIKRLWEETAWETLRPNGVPLHWRTPVEIEWGKRWGSPEWKLDAKGNIQQL